MRCINRTWKAWGQATGLMIPRTWWCTSSGNVRFSTWTLVLAIFRERSTLSGFSPLTDCDVVWQALLFTDYTAGPVLMARWRRRNGPCYFLGPGYYSTVESGMNTAYFNPHNLIMRHSACLIANTTAQEGHVKICRTCEIGILQSSFHILHYDTHWNHERSMEMSVGGVFQFTFLSLHNSRNATCELNMEMSAGMYISLLISHFTLYHFKVHLTFYTTDAI